MKEKGETDEIKKHHVDIVELKKEHEETFFSSVGFQSTNKKKVNVRDKKDLAPATDSAAATSTAETNVNSFVQQESNDKQQQNKQQQNQQQQNQQHQQQQQHLQQKQHEKDRRQFHLDESTRHDERPGASSQREDQQTDLLIFMDSNRKHINWRQFWTLKGTEKYFCGKLIDVEKRFREETASSIKYILIHVGVNDLDTRTPEQVTEHLKVIIAGMRKKFQGVKIIVSEITPRNDEKDADVRRCNELINALYGNQGHITIAPHSNLRDDDWSMYDDAKHITKAAIPRLVSNIKRALRKAYGITTDGSKPRMSSKLPLENRLQNIAGYSNRNQNRKAPMSKAAGLPTDPNIVLMQVAQLLHLTAPP